MKRTDPSVLQSLTFTSMYTTGDPGVSDCSSSMLEALGSPQHRTEQQTVLFACQDDHTKQFSLNSLTPSMTVTSISTNFSYFHSYILEFILETLNQWFSASFLIPQNFSTVPHVVVTPNNEIILFLHPKCNFAIVMNCDINICYAFPVKESFDSKGSQLTGSEPRFKPKCFTLIGKNTHQYITSGFLDKEIINIL